MRSHDSPFRRSAVSLVAFRYFENPGYVRMPVHQRARVLLVEPERPSSDSLTRLLKRRFRVESLRPGSVFTPHDLIVIDEDATCPGSVHDIIASSHADEPICLLSSSPTHGVAGGEHVHRLSKSMASGELLRTITGIAQQAQRTFDEHTLHAAPRFADVNVSSTFLWAEPSVGAGGDWYDVMLSHNRLAFAIGDVTGHGETAAITTNLIRRAMATLLLRNVDPAAILSRVNSLILKTGALQATAICGYVEPRTRRIVYASGGHPPPISANPADAAFERYGGLMLGVQERADYSTFGMTPAENGLFVLYTDGVTEAGSGRFDGDQRLLRAARAAAAEISDAARSIQDGVFCGVPPRDDASIVVFAFGPSPGPITATR